MLRLSNGHAAPPPPPPRPARLPRGSCRFILLHPDITGQRCSCQSFSLHEAVPGSSCACGHQACYHLTEARGDGVSRQEHDALQARVLRLEALLEKARPDDVRARIGSLEEAVDQGHHTAEEGHQRVQRALQGLYGHMGQLHRMAWQRVAEQQDAVEAVMDRLAGVEDELRRLADRIVALDDATMELDDRLGAPASPAPDHARRIIAAPSGLGITTVEAVSSGSTSTVLPTPAPATTSSSTPTADGNRPVDDLVAGPLPPDALKPADDGSSANAANAAARRRSSIATPFRPAAPTYRNKKRTFSGSFGERADGHHHGLAHAHSHAPPHIHAA